MSANTSAIANHGIGSGFTPTKWTLSARAFHVRTQSFEVGTDQIASDPYEPHWFPRAPAYLGGELDKHVCALAPVNGPGPRYNRRICWDAKLASNPFDLSVADTTIGE
ncbi:MAG: hypothetical protein R2735_08885 [Microthrixaceae bacterium]